MDVCPQPMKYNEGCWLTFTEALDQYISARLALDKLRTSDLQVVIDWAAKLDVAVKHMEAYIHNRGLNDN